MILPLLLLAFVTSAAQAGRNADGAMVVHTNNMIIYTPDYYCDTPALPTVCEELDPNGTQGINTVQVIWLMAAFCPAASPAVTAVQFGIEHNLPANQGYFSTFSACGPSAIELPDQGWPETGFGDVIAYGSAVYDHVFRFYYFTVFVDGPGNYFGTRTYPGTNEAKFVDDGGPPVEDLCFNFGMFRWDGSGRNDCPSCEVPVGACCFCDGHCETLLAYECEAVGGAFYGIGVPCDPNPCSVAMGACCFPDGQCTVTTCTQCPLDGGVWQGPGTDCEPNDCAPPPTGACCFYATGTCQILSQPDCSQQGGEYLGDFEPCEPNPCLGFPTVPTTWGRIKATYR
jgi:hypothetical protein